MNTTKCYETLHELLNLLRNVNDPRAGDKTDERKVIEALEFVVLLLKVRLEREEKAGSALPAKAGARWTEEERQSVYLQHRTGISTADIAASHRRSEASIEGQLFRGALSGQIPVYLSTSKKFPVLKELA